MTAVEVVRYEHEVPNPELRKHASTRIGGDEELTAQEGSDHSHEVVIK